jgi:hypothetical protein
MLNDAACGFERGRGSSSQTPDHGKVRRVLSALSAISLKGSGRCCIGLRELTMLRKPLPCKAYHDESRLSLRVIDAVPYALIVFAVLFWHTTVSLLDRWIRFDYPERALVGMLVHEDTRCVVVQRPAASLDSFSLKSGFL